jgi:hypothetical protein
VRRHLDLSDIWRRTGLDKKETLLVEMAGTAQTAELFWSLVIGMAMKDGAWCVRYHLQGGDRTCCLNYFLDWVGYGLVPPPDEMAELLIRGLDRLTRPRGATGLLASLRSHFGGRVTRAFDVTYGPRRDSWVASWPGRATDGAIVLFRERVAGLTPLGRGVDRSPESGDEVRDLHRHGGQKSE